MKRIIPHVSAGRQALAALFIALLMFGTGCAGKKKATATEPPASSVSQTTKASSPSSEEADKESRPGFFARLNPFRKKEEPPTEQASNAKERTTEDGLSKEKDERWFFSRWFGGPAKLPSATEETFEERQARTAKGEVSPPSFEYNGLKLELGRTSKARIIATYGEPENIFFSEGAEEILIYRRVRDVDSLYIFLDSQGLVKDYIITKRQ